MKNRKPKQIRKMTLSMIAVGAATAFLGMYLNELTALMLLGIGIMLAAIAFHLVFYRCPHCGKFLDRSAGEYCPYCGKNVSGD